MKPANYAPIYACVYAQLAEVARSHGYALAAHGSLAADFDLVCIPWVPGVSDPQSVVDEITSRFAIKQVGAPEQKEHGRIAYTISFKFGECRLDLSFMQSAQPARQVGDIQLSGEYHADVNMLLGRLARQVGGDERASWFSCPHCGTHEVSLERTCHNSSCLEYAYAKTVHEGWKDRAALAPAAVDKTAIETALAIKVEKLLCAKLGREWSAAGISIESLVDELAPAAAEPIYQAMYRLEGGGGYGDVTAAQYAEYKGNPKVWAVRIVYPSPVPAAVVMPERMTNIQPIGDWGKQGYNEALDEVARLNRNPIPVEELEALRRDAGRWRAFINCARIKFFGWAGYTNPDPNGNDPKNYRHFGGEFWSIHEAPTADKEKAHEILNGFADAAIAQQQELRALLGKDGAA